MTDKLTTYDPATALVDDEGRLPFAVEVPNRITHKVMAELDAGKGKRFDSADALFKDLGI